MASTEDGTGPTIRCLLPADFFDPLPSRKRFSRPQHMPISRKYSRSRTLLPLALVALLAACASPMPGNPEGNRFTGSAWADGSLRSADDSGWQHQAFPGKTATEFQPAHKLGRHAIAVRSESSASMLRQRVRIEPDRLGRLRFSWLVPALIASADMSSRDADDSPVRLILMFEGDRSRFSARDAALSDLSEALTGEPLPYATLMYVWSNHGASSPVIINPRTGRIRKLVMESGAGKLGQWLDYERDVRADFQQAFGEAPGAMVAIGIMTDTDNTRSLAQAWYGPIAHLPGPAKPVTALAD